MTKHQGLHSEHKFAELCTKKSEHVEAVVHRPANDEHGWDFCVELTVPFKPQIPADLRLQVTRCFCQIKSTVQRTRKVRIKLSNALKAVESPLPHFIFLLAYDATTALCAIYGRHIWTDEIHAWLKAARQTELQQSPDIRKIQVALAFSDADKISGHVAEWMLSKIESVGNDYALQKDRLYRNVGYDEIRMQGIVTFDGREAYKDLIDCEIGLRQDVEIERFVLFDERFGIKSRQPVNDFSRGKLSLKRGGQPLLLRVETAEGDFETGARGWSPSIVAPTAPEFKVRVTCGLLELVFTPNQPTSTFSFHFHPEEVHSLPEHVACLYALTGTVDRPAEIEVKSDLGAIFRSKVPECEFATPWAGHALRASRLAMNVLGYENARSTKTKLVRLAKRAHLVSWITDFPLMKLVSRFDEAVDDFTMLAGYFVGEVGGWSIGLIVAMDLAERSSGADGDEFVFKGARIVKKMAAKVSIEDMTESVKKEFSDFMRAEGAPVATIQDGDFAEWSRLREAGSPIDISIVGP